MGSTAGAASPARVHTPLLGADVVLEAGASAELALDPSFEHALLVLEGAAAADGEGLDRTVLDAAAADGAPLLHLPPGRSSVRLTGGDGARLLLLGGEPYADDLVMWWNFVGRTHEEVARAREDWETQGQERFGTVPGHGAERIPAPPMPGVRLTPRRRPGRGVEVQGAHEAPPPAMS